MLSVKNITARQEALLGGLRALDPGLRLRWDEVRGVAGSVRGKLAAEAAGDRSAKSAAEAFLAVHGELFGPVDMTRTLKLLRQRTDDLGWTHLEYQQFHPLPPVWLGRRLAPLEVYGAKLVTHLAPDGTVTEVQSSCWRDITVAFRARLTARGLRDSLLREAEGIQGFQSLQRQMQERKEENFPLMQRPRLVVYPWQGGFRLAWTTYAYAAVDVENPHTGKPTGAKGIALGQIFVDASTGERLVFAPTRIHAETPDTGTGLGVTPLGGPYVSRNLSTVRVDSTSTYRLRDTTHSRDIITYDTAASSSWSSTSQITGALSGGTLPVSEDTDGDKNWNRTAADTSDAQRTASQQPEVDAHYICREAYEWYNALAGSRAGWDDGQYPNPPVPPQPVRALTHVYDSWMGTSRSVNAFFDKGLQGGNWYAFLAFFDGDPTQTCSSSGDVGFDYLAGSKMVVAHEYQHAMTDFSFEDAAGNPGLTYSGWFAAVHEGLSDVFGCLFSEGWTPDPEISNAGLVLRNVAYPRDPNSWSNRTGTFPCGLSNHNKDHFADRNLDAGFRYDRGTILAHCAYLMGPGGVHQRASRTPALIPVYAMGRQTVGGKNVLKAARIWYRALSYYFSTHGVLTGVPTNDENTFRTLRDACVSSAIDLYGSGSLEHLTTILAFYAVGLHPTGTNYGADVTFLRWGTEWRLSRPYLGGIHSTCSNWSSLDLFINNGGTSEWNALINVTTPTGPTQFENTVYCRVRNVGDQDALNVQVQFYYAKAGTAVWTWLPVTDKDGNVQTLNAGTLSAGQSTFSEANQNAPPASAGVKWYIPPLAAGETVHHYCLKAVVSSSNDVNTFNNEVQSNIAYTAYTPGSPLHMWFMAGNPTKRRIPLELAVHPTLPKEWKASLDGAARDVRLNPGEERAVAITLDMPPGADRQLEPPFDGELKGQLYGSMSAPFTGALTRVKWDGNRLRGLLTANIADLGQLVGAFDGRVDVSSATVKGRVLGSFQCSGRDSVQQMCAGVEACLRPLRRVDISQLVDGVPFGGITIQVQVPTPCAEALPPTDTRVRADGTAKLA